MVAERFEESLPISEKALALARHVGDPRQRSARSPCSASTAPTSATASPALVHVSTSPPACRGDPGDRIGLERAYVNLTDALTMLGRSRESARLGKSGLEAMRRYGIESTLLVDGYPRVADRDRRLGRRGHTQCGRPSRNARQLPPLPPHRPRRPRDRTRRLRGRTHPSRGRAPHCAKTEACGTTSSTSQNWPCGNSGGPRPTMPFVTAWRDRVRGTPHSCVSRSARKGFAHPRN